MCELKNWYVSGGSTFSYTKDESQKLETCIQLAQSGTLNSPAVSLKSCEDKDTLLIVQTKRGFLEANPLCIEPLAFHTHQQLQEPRETKNFSPHNQSHIHLQMQYNSRRNPLNAGKMIRGSKKSYNNSVLTDSESEKGIFSNMHLFSVLTTTYPQK